ncbi:metallophosphoesterase family protein [Rhabdaerophilum sp. SD176]|uniref:metallophosphoesterase family protein n=1 Tax=Rhabdaerophilum sp. SD176 TaxID=2983548 RepID=UPI0024DF4C92|nr:metallophosphoesterase family protein [Rhabdaerophilum sp. SD176]
MRLAILADIHGNVLALEAVLRDIDRQGADMLFDLGDRVSGPLWPRETLDLMRKHAIPGVRGNHDRLAGSESPDGLGPSDRFAFDALDAESRALLRALPFEASPAPGICAFHATPQHDDRYVVEDIAEGRLVRAPADKITRRLGLVEASIVLFGHSHRPDLLRLPDRRWILNPGSVGCAGYQDVTGRAHVSESGTPLACYALLTLTASGQPDVTFRALPYDNEAAARRAQENGRPDWAAPLRSGWMPAALGGSAA